MSKYDYITKEFFELEYFTLGKSLDIIAKDLGILKSTLYYIFKKYKLNVRATIWNKGLSAKIDSRLNDIGKRISKSKIGSIPWNKGKICSKKIPIDSIELLDLYVTKQLSMKDCSKHFNCSGHTIADRLKELSIDIRPMVGDTHALKGKTPSLKTRKKISLTLGGTGNSSDSNGGYKDFTYNLRDSIRARDNYCCNECGYTNEESLVFIGRSLPVHHIDYDKANSVTTNLITLCDSCHSRTNIDRKYWQKYFEDKMSK